jgi:hypothetical protein
VVKSARKSIFNGSQYYLIVKLFLGELSQTVVEDEPVRVRHLHGIIDEGCSI